jgi:hypothetical protein
MAATVCIQQCLNIIPPPSTFKEDSAYKWINNLAEVDMRLWKFLPDMQSLTVYAIILKITTDQEKYIEVQKDYLNNLFITGIDFIDQQLASLKVQYILPSILQNTYCIQDIIASEVIKSNYKVIGNEVSNNQRTVTLQKA